MKRTILTFVMALPLLAGITGCTRAANDQLVQDSPTTTAPAGGPTDSATSDPTTRPTTPPPPTTKPPAGLKKVEITLTGFTVIGTGPSAKVTYAVAFKNPNTDWLADGLGVWVNFNDGAGKRIGGDVSQVSALPPGVTSAAARTVDGPAETAAVTATISVREWRKSKATWPTVEIKDPRIDRTSKEGSIYKAAIISHDKAPLRGVVIVAVGVNGLLASSGATLTNQTLMPEEELQVSIPAGGSIPTTITTVRFFVIPRAGDTRG